MSTRYDQQVGMTEGALTRETLDAAIEAVKKRGSTPRHSCRFDGHVFQFSPTGWHRCLYCGLLIAEDVPGQS